MQELPAVPGARFAVGTNNRTDEGGTEWADRIVLDGGWLAVVLGRLPGLCSGERAASLVERLRGAVAMALLGMKRDTGELLLDMHRFTQHESDLRGATLCITLFDPTTGELSCVTAGRPGPWVLDGAGGMRQLLGTRSGPLGEAEHTEIDRLDSTHQLATGETVVLYGAESTWTAMDLAELLTARMSADPDVLVADADAFAGMGARVAMVAFTRVPVPGGSLTLERPANADELPGIRRQFEYWLDAVCCPPETAQRLVLALNEAVTNAVEHAYRGATTDTVRVSAEIEQDRSIRITVADNGSWRVPQPAGSYRGRGLLMMQEVVDRVAIDRDSRGTTVSLVVQPRAADAAARSAEPSRSNDEHELDVRVHGEVATVTIRGDVPEHGAAGLRRGLLAASCGASLRLVVELAEVGSEFGGLVHALFDVAGAARDAGGTLVVRAPEGSQVRTLAEMSGLHQAVQLIDHQ